MKHNSSTTVNITKMSAGKGFETEEVLAVEEPLEIELEIHSPTGRLRKSIAVTMRTPGADDLLAAGFLFTEGIINNKTEISSIQQTGENNVLVQLQEGINPSLKKTERNFYTTSSCGVCGKASIEAIGVELLFKIDPPAPFTTAAILHQLPAKLRQQQPVFKVTGGLHASALFTPGGDFIALQEDVGRHNALDKLVGQALLGKTLPLSNSILILSGRASFELLQKAARAGISTVAAVGAPSSLAVELAVETGITLVGFLKEDRMNVYSHPQRIAV
jgi:FdhD protein